MTKAITQAHTSAHLITLLRPEQMPTVELVLRGFSDVDIAKELSLRRETICRWRNQDETFRAVLQRRRAEMLETSAAQLQGMAEEATQVVLRGIRCSEKGDPRLAMALLEKLGVFERGRELERGGRAPVWAGEVREKTEEEALEETLNAVEASVEAKVKRLGAGALGDGPETGVRAGRGADRRFVANRE